MKKAFTLIELLVVIAIIAILAAILFPVFAQAKDAAKNSVVLSNTKQMGLAALMYSADTDDQFPLAQYQDTNGNWDTWQGTIQPYTKNWQVIQHIKLPNPTGPNDYWLRIQHFGAALRSAAQLTPSADGFYTVAGVAPLTGSATVRFDGVFGSGIDVNSGGWENRGIAPSLSQTSIAEVSNTVMFVEANNWDLRWGGGGPPMLGCGTYGAGADGDGKHGQMHWNGPMAYTRPKDGKTGAGPACNLNVIPDGMTTYVATDGSAKSVDYRGRLHEKVNNGTYTYFKYFWPTGG